MNASSVIGPALWAISFVVGITPTAKAQDFGEWRALTFEEQRAHIAGIPAESVDPLMIEADFDGNGRIDKALIAIRKADLVLDLIVDLGDQTHVLVRSEPGGEGVALGAGVGLAQPGRWETVCGNAFRDLQGGMCELENYPRVVRLRHPGILAITDSAALLHFWNFEKRAFDAVVLRN